MAVDSTMEAHLTPRVSLWELFGGEETSTNLQVGAVSKRTMPGGDNVMYHWGGKCNEHEAQDHRKELHGCSCIEGFMSMKRQEFLEVMVLEVVVLEKGRSMLEEEEGDQEVRGGGYYRKVEERRSLVVLLASRGWKILVI